MKNEAEKQGIDSLPSRYSVEETLDRLTAALQARGIKIFARIDQRAEAEAVGLTLRPTQLLLFGDPRAGTPLMTSFSSLAIDLPLKALAWEDETGQVRLSFNSPSYLQQRHGLPHPPFEAAAVLVRQAAEA